MSSLNAHFFEGTYFFIIILMCMCFSSSLLFLPSTPPPLWTIGGPFLTTGEVWAGGELSQGQLPCPRVGLRPLTGVLQI